MEFKKLKWEDYVSIVNRQVAYTVSGTLYRIYEIKNGDRYDVRHFMGDGDYQGKEIGSANTSGGAKQIAQDHYEACLRKAMQSEKTGWINIYSSCDGYGRTFLYETKEEADLKANQYRLACIKIEWEE